MELGFVIMALNVLEYFTWSVGIFQGKKAVYNYEFSKLNVLVNLTKGSLFIGAINIIGIIVRGVLVDETAAYVIIGVYILI